MHLAIIINSIVCVIGAILGALLAARSIISIADAQSPWRGKILVAALLIPAIFLVSGFGAWLAEDSYGASEVAIGFIALPWVYSLSFVVFKLVFLKA